MTFAEWMRSTIDELEVTPCPRVQVGMRRRYITYSQAVRLLRLLTRK